MKDIALQAATREPHAGRQKAERHALSLKSMPGAPVIDFPLIQRRPSCACGGGCPRCEKGALPVQTKLRVGAPGDEYEQEADRVAEQVMRTPGSAIQRSCASCEQGGSSCPACEADEKVSVQRKAAPHSSHGGASVPDNFMTSLGAGQPLDSGTRAFMEPRFGYDFSRVRIHTGERAAQSARQLNALAYTLGHDIVLGAGQTSYETPGGLRLLAHELTHVIQQGGGQSLLGRPSFQRVHSRVSRMVQRQQTDAGFEAGSGVGTGISNGTMVANNSIMGHTFTAPNCRGLYGCNINFEFGKAYSGIYPYAAAGRDVRGIYVKISASFNSSICGTCSTVHLIQNLRYVTQGTGGMQTARPTTDTRRERAGWGSATAPSRGWGIDQEGSTSPFVTAIWTANPGTSTTPAVLWDVPGHWTDVMNNGKEFQTCAVCENAGAQRRVMACVNWGYYTDSTGVISFRPATPTAACGPTQELQDATTRWEAIAGNLPANIDFSAEVPENQTNQRSVLWFQYNSTTLRQDAEIDSRVHMTGALRRIRQHLLAVGNNARIVVHGYASEEGDAGYNMQLSRRRAEAIQAQLIAAGIPADRISIQPHGEDTSMPTRAYNRRVEIEHTAVAAAP